MKRFGSQNRNCYFQAQWSAAQAELSGGGAWEEGIAGGCKAPEDLEYLTKTILKFCGDQKSINFYKKVARTVPRNIIFRALSEAKVSDDLSETIKSKAAHFTFLIKKYAKEQGKSKL